jgi:hypothetical protein
MFGTLPPRIMNPRKSELREIVLAIIFGKENVAYDPFQFAHLTLGVSEVLRRRAGGTSSASIYSEQRLNDADTMLVQEIFWDLIVERVITIGGDAANAQLPWYRLHSDAIANLKRGNQ